MNIQMGFPLTKNLNTTRKAVRNRMRLMVFIGTFGVLLLTVLLTGVYGFCVQLDRYFLSAGIGIGCGLLVGAAAVWIRYRLLLKDERKLFSVRRQAADERNQEISRRAFQAASVVGLTILYIAGWVCGLFDPVLLKVLFVFVLLFLLLYQLFYGIYEQKL